MKRVGKTRFITLAALATAAMLALSGCCFPADERADVVFVNDSAASIGSVGLTSAGSAQMGQNADNSPLDWGESMAFQVDEYPVMVTVYGDVDGRQKLASCTIKEEPKGERWYVTARNGGSGVVLEAGVQWPLEDS